MRSLKRKNLSKQIRRREVTFTPAMPPAAFRALIVIPGKKEGRCCVSTPHSSLRYHMSPRSQLQTAAVATRQAHGFPNICFVHCSLASRVLILISYSSLACYNVYRLVASPFSRAVQLC